MIPPGTVLAHPRDIHDFWTKAMGPLGFSFRLLWLALFDADDRLLPVLPTIDDIPELANQTEISTVMSALAEVLPPGGSAAILLSRPGGRMTGADRQWARALLAAAGTTGVALRLVHLATDEVLVQFAPDDLCGVA